MAEKKLVEQPVEQQEDKKVIKAPRVRVPAVIKARVPNKGRLSPFNVLVGDDTIFVGSRVEAYEKAEEYNTIHGLGSTVKEILS